MTNNFAYPRADSIRARDQTDLEHSRTTNSHLKSESDQVDQGLRAEISDVQLRPDGLLHLEGHALVRGLSNDRYGLTKNKLVLENDSKAGRDCWYPLATLNKPDLNQAIGQEDQIDYSHAAIATLGKSGINLSSLPAGRYTVGLSVERAEGTFEQEKLRAPVHDAWTLVGNAIIGSVSNGQLWKLYSLPTPGRDIHDAYFEPVELEVKDSRLHLQGYFVPYGKDFPTWDSIDYFLALSPVDSSQPESALKLANGSRENAHLLTGEHWRDQSKAYYATRDYAGLDLTNIMPGRYKLSVSARVGDDLAHRSLNTTLNVTSQDSLQRESPPDVSIIGSCVTRDNFNSSISPNWKTLWKLNHTFYQSSLISLMSDTVNVTDDFLSGLNAHDRDVVVRDMTKIFLDELLTSPPEVIIVDLFADTRFGVMKMDNSWITHNDWKLPNAKGYESVRDNVRINGLTCRAEYLDLFTSKTVQFREFVAENLPGTTVCLNSARNVYIHRGINTPGEKFSRERIDELNQLWKQLDDLFVQIMNPAVIDSMDPSIQSDSQHRWGPGPVHYEERYYSQFHALLRKQLGIGACYSIAM